MIPLLEDNGVLVAHTIILDDYFRAGEVLYYGDPVVVWNDVNNNVWVYRAKWGVESWRTKGKVVGAVHTPPGCTVGDKAADPGEYAALVMHGRVKSKVSGIVGADDAVTVSGVSGIYEWILHLGGEKDHAAPTRWVTGRTLDAPDGNNIVDIWVDVA